MSIHILQQPTFPPRMHGVNVYQPLPGNMATHLTVPSVLRAPSPCPPSSSLIVPKFYQLKDAESRSTPNLVEPSRMSRRGPFDILRTPQWHLHGYGYPSYRFGRTNDCTKDDILTGYARNEALGWYKEEADSSSSRRAMNSLGNHRVAHYDWAYHRR